MRVSLYQPADLGPTNQYASRRMYALPWQVGLYNCNVISTELKFRPSLNAVRAAAVARAGEL